jgi:hypothetical protein
LGPPAVTPIQASSIPHRLDLFRDIARRVIAASAASMQGAIAARVPLCAKGTMADLPGMPLAARSIWLGIS